MKHSLLLIALLVLCLAIPALAQISLNDLTSPNKKQSCADTVSVEDLVENADLAFTGRVVERDDNFTWFRIYVPHHGKPESGIIKTAGFFARDTVVAGAGQSYEVGEIYTAIVHRPKSKEEKKLGVDFVNSLDHCEEAVVSKIHDRYSVYRVTPEQLQPGFSEKLGNHWFHNKFIYLTLIALILAAGLWAGFRTQIKAAILRLQKSV